MLLPVFGLEISVLYKELFNVTPVYFWIYYITSIWNKWECERVNKVLDSYYKEDYYDLYSTPNEDKYR